jgi:beta-mannosidase
MQASFAWDWGLAAPSMGIWKDVVLEVYDSILIRDITYEVLLNPIQNDTEFWEMMFYVHVESGQKNESLDGILSYELVNVFPSQLKNCHVDTDGDGRATLNFTVKIHEEKIQLWWTNGLGSQVLYKLIVKWEDVRVNDVNFNALNYLMSEKTINIGFRTVELEQAPCSNGLQFFFKINGIPIFMKGSNWIPSHVLPEKSANVRRIEKYLLATKDANMNMLRVWGGGLYESDEFYNLADKYGILIWQDMMFACAMYPLKNFVLSVKKEIELQIKRIQYHPSIAIYATNNENEAALRQNWYGTQSNFITYAQDYNYLYNNVIYEEIMKHDKNRFVLLSSPSNGAWTKDKDSYGIIIFSLFLWTNFLNQLFFLLKVLASIPRILILVIFISTR